MHSKGIQSWTTYSFDYTSTTLVERKKITEKSNYIIEMDSMTLIDDAKRAKMIARCNGGVGVPSNAKHIFPPLLSQIDYVFAKIGINTCVQFRMHRK